MYIIIMLPWKLYLPSVFLSSWHFRLPSDQHPEQQLLASIVLRLSNLEFRANRERFGCKHGLDAMIFYKTHKGFSVSCLRIIFYFIFIFVTRTSASAPLSCLSVCSSPDEPERLEALLFIIIIIFFLLLKRLSTIIVSLFRVYCSNDMVPVTYFFILNKKKKTKTTDCNPHALEFPFLRDPTRAVAAAA